MEPAPAFRPQDNIRGIIMMVGGFGSFAVADTIAKVLTASYHPIQIVATRQLGLMVGAAVLIAYYGPGLLRSVAPKFQIARGLVAIVSAVCFVIAIKYVPLADAVAVSFVAPFMVTILGALLLGEPVGRRRWIAVSAGFVGALIIVRPGLGIFHPAIFLVLLAALAFAFRQVISRYIGDKDRTETTMAYTALTTVIILAIPLPLFWQTPNSGTHLLMMIALAAFAGFGEYLFIRALEVAHAVVLAPMHYSLIIFGTFWGFFVFKDLPDLWTWVGSFVIISSGLYMLYREYQLRKSRALNDT